MIKKVMLKILFIFVLISTSCFDVDFKDMFYSEITVDERFAQSYKWNQEHGVNHLKIESDSYNFLLAGDSHVGPTRNLEDLINEANKSDYLFYSILGDLTTGHAEDYNRLKATIDSLSTRQYYFIAGNHDLYFDGWEYYFKLFGSSSYIVEIETANTTDLLIFLDSGNATLGKSQMDWLEGILADTRENYQNCMIFSHVNFYRLLEHKTGSTTFLVEELTYLMNLFNDYNVDFVVAGHDHYKYIVNFGNTQYITLNALKDDFENAGYVKVQNIKGLISYEFINL